MIARRFGDLQLLLRWRAPISECEENQNMNRITKSWALRHLAIAAMVLGASSGWAATHPKLSPELTSARSGQWVNVIVQYSGLTDNDFAQARTMGKRGASLNRLPLINLDEVKADELGVVTGSAMLKDETRCIRCGL